MLALPGAVTANKARITFISNTTGEFAMDEFRVHLGKNTLPVSFNNDLTAKLNGSQVNLSWSTSSEQNSAYFQVLRSTNGTDFSPIGGQITAAGNSNATKTYHATDFSPAKGTNYYKLNQVDNNGSVNQLPQVVSAKVATSSLEITAALGTSNGVELTVFSPKSAKATVSLVNAMGQALATTSIVLSEGNNKVTLPSTAKGLVIATVNVAGTKLSKKLIK